MVKKKSYSKMPKSFEKLLKDNNMLTGKPLVFAMADMDDTCNFRDHAVLLCDDCIIHAFASEITLDREVSNKSRTKKDFSLFKTEKFPIETLSDLFLEELVVGGVFCIEIDKTARRICGFTNGFKRKFNIIYDIAKSLLNGEEIKEEKLFEEIREETCPKCGKTYPNRERKVCPKCMDKRRVFFRLASYFKPHIWLIVFICIICILGALLTSLWPYLSGSILYDEVLTGNIKSIYLKSLNISDLPILLLVLAATMAGVKILQQIFGIIQGRLVSKIVPSVVCKLKNRVFSSIQLLSVSFFTGKQTGGLMTRITNDAEQVSNLFIDGIPHILPNIFTIIFSCIVMLKSNWILTVAAMIALPPLVLITLKIEPILWHYNSKQHQTTRNLRAKLNDNLTGARVIKAFGREESEANRLSLANEAMYNAQLGAMTFDTKFSMAWHLAKTLSSVFVWALGACFVVGLLKPSLTYGTLITFTGYVSLLSGPVDFFSNLFRWWSSSMNSAQRIFEIIDAKPDVTENNKPIRLQRIKGGIKLEDVSFGYEENREVLKDIDLEVKPGQMLGIVGKSGAGKSTLANLIARLYDPNTGNIYLDGVNIRDMAFDELRRTIALVSQETYIFKGSIFDNIAYANPAADRKAVLDAAVASSAHDFICRLPDGYDTIVGTGGRSLSGGERQRISIARAILADPKILILDEATAAVDTETEKRIQISLQQLIKNRTTLSIAHRLSTLREADFLIVLEDGKIVEQGTHAQLVDKKGAYYKLLQIQSKALAMRSIGD